MSVPPEVMQRLQGGGPQGGAAPSPKPSAAPMAKPQENEGLKEAARVNVHIAMNMLEQSLAPFGSESKEGKAVLKILSMLSKEFGESDSGDLVPAEIMQMNKSLPQAGGGTDIQRQLQKMQQGGAPPGGAPAPQPAMM